MPIENPFSFYPRYIFESVSKLWGYGRWYREMRVILKVALAAPDRAQYSDIAIAPRADDLDVLDLYHATSGGEAALTRMRRDEAIRETVQHLNPAA